MSVSRRGEAARSRRGEAARFLQERRRIRGSLSEWARFCGFEPAAHHRLIINSLERLTVGACPRLAIFMPPGSAKSTYASKLFPAWFFSHFPKAQVIGASHTEELADKWSREVRNLIHEHRHVLGVGLASDTKAVGYWRTDQGGEYIASGVSGSLPGRRGDLVVIDDPVSSAKAADSEVERDNAWRFYITDVRPRLKPGGRVVLIQTRWHEDDLAGRIFATDTGEQWEVLSLPAIAEDNDPLGRKPGEWLWGDDGYGYAKRLQEEQRVQLASGMARNWTALYQQRPAPEEGNYFKAEWLKTYDRLPDRETLYVYGGSDYAVTPDGGDYTVHAVVGVGPEGRLYLLDLWRKQTAADEWIEAFCDLVLKWRPIGWAEETGQIKAGVGPFIERRQREREAFVARQTFPTRGDKAIRAQSIRGRMAQSGLYVPNTADWYPTLRAELLSFPAGRHDDQVDALGLIGQLLATMVSGPVVEKPEPKSDISGYKEWTPAVQPGDWLAY